MPYSVKKSGSGYSVVKKATGKAIKGGHHASKAKAERQMRAIYANEKKR